MQHNSTTNHASFPVQANEFVRYVDVHDTLSVAFDVAEIADVAVGFVVGGCAVCDVVRVEVRTRGSARREVDAVCAVCFDFFLSGCMRR